MQITDLKKLLSTYDIRPDKGKGQHFLLDESVVADMLEAASVSQEGTVLEVGPGPGVLTSALAQRAGHIICYELDDKLADLIEAQGIPNIEVVRGDVLTHPLPRRGTTLPYKVVANIPYSITGALIRKLLTSLPAPKSITLLVQREVAERMCAGPGQMSILSVATQLHGNARIVRIVPAEAFYPAPKVDSAVVHVDIKPDLTLDVDEKAFMRIVKIGFSQKRKQLKNTLAAGLHREPSEIEPYLEQAGLALTARAQELRLEDWHKLYTLLNN
ncbi:ribosomal RNA small subunit methyltransferase A [Candidatus Saccharibacteria bacterium]|nr:ribosomal RNA small subunit methyltransferase A [Candidatus Saccharibacteria bacterium]